MSSYDPKKVIILWGPLLLDGFAEGSMIQVSRPGEGAQAFVGTGGEAVTVVDHDDRAEVTVNLMRTGAGRNTLAALMASYNLDRGLALPLAITSIDTGEALATGRAVLKKQPDLDFSNEAPSAEIMFVCERMDYQLAPDV